MKKLLPRLSIASFLLFGPGLAHGAYHTVVSGDTLSQIAENTYGNWIKFNDIWKMNQDLVNDPHWIYPGQKLRLLAGEELTKFAQNNGLSVPGSGEGFDSESESDADHGIIRRRSGRSEEWRLLPKQSWEHFIFKKNAQVDSDGFDRRSIVANRVVEKSTATITIAPDRIPISGEITQSRSPYDRLFLGDQVFIRGDEQLQVNQVYSVTTGPQKIVAPRDGRVGFAYDLTGKIRIIGVRDGVFIGTVVAIFYPIRRGQLLIPEVKDYKFPPAISALTPVAATIVVPEGARDDMLGEQKIVYLDVGSQDGVQPGTIFRHYLHTDPYTNKPISAKDFLIESELKVLSVQEKFSVAIILHARNSLHFGEDLTALTDLRDFEKNQGLQTLLQDSTKPTTVDDLDQMDANDGLGEKENLDLKQLEKWQKPSPSQGTGNGLVPDEEIQKVNTRAHPTETYEIGKEPAPNDGTSNKAPSMEEPKVVNPSQPPPEMAPANPSETPPAVVSHEPSAKSALPPPTAPEASSTPPPAPPPLMSDPSLDAKTSIESSAPPPTNPAPIQDPATGTPTGADPFSAPPPPSQ